MCGTPGLLALVGNSETFRQVAYILISIFDIKKLAYAVAYSFFKVLLNLFFNDENNGFKTCLFCIVKGVVDDDFSVWADRVNLFNPPKRLPIPAAITTNTGFFISLNS